ncbi:cytidylate kinase family protein [Candidatus Woesearchaeota archaeon]|nr:cytidylate kinase family protein [Candidatus Woesearchaeota archaeon]
MIITISGDLGSGKSVVADAAAKKYNLKRYSAGDFMREMAKERGMSLLELSKIAEKDRSIDKEIDERTKKLAEKEDNFVIDARLGFHFIPKAIKIYMKVDPGEAAKRIVKRKQAGEEGETEVEETKQHILRRKRSEKERYMEYYDVDIDDESQYDIVFDTTHTKCQEGIDAILDLVDNFIKEHDIQ